MSTRAKMQESATDDSWQTVTTGESVVVPGGQRSMRPCGFRRTAPASSRIAHVLAGTAIGLVAG
jgi:hypothetical protein